MYLGRAKKAIDQQDEKEFQDKLEKHAERQERELSKNETTSKSEMMEEFKPDELPDGACFRPKSIVAGTEDGETAIRSTEVISFIFK